MSDDLLPPLRIVTDDRVPPDTVLIASSQDLAREFRRRMIGVPVIFLPMPPSAARLLTITGI